jgi:hypothetical protein
VGGDEDGNSVFQIHAQSTGADGVAFVDSVMANRVSGAGNRGARRLRAGDVSGTRTSAVPGAAGKEPNHA